MHQQRDHFRIVFPLGQRPLLTSGLAEREVIDLSENGAKIAATGNGHLSHHEAIEATIKFHDGTIVAVTARVQRQETADIVLHFNEQLSYSLIMAEQRRLLRLYPREKLV